jgi:hydrogenase expression/formation protein HypE
VLLAHGEGARLTRRLIREVLLPAFDNDFLRPLADGAVLPAVAGGLVLSTDGYVVSPLFFPGGDIGRLAVHGTVNDLAVCGAEPLYLSLGLIAEEGLPLETLRRVVASAADAARACGVPVVTGDTKVVPRGAADGLFVHATGLGRLRSGADLGAHRARPGDRLLISGTVGDHGIAVLSAREGLGLGGELASDTAPLHGLVAALFSAGIDVRFLRDPTRGGVAAVLHELAEGAGAGVVLDEVALPLSPPVRGACEILGLDPLHVANEGKLLAVVAAADAERALACLRGHPLGRRAAIIGEVTASGAAEVLVRGALGALRVLDEPTGAPLPRIC